MRPLPSATILAAFLLVIPACSSDSEQPRAGAEAKVEAHRPLRPPNILLISIDTLRADHLGSYGYARDTSPNLDRLAARSIRYTNAYAPAPWTLPSHVAMLSGRHPFDAGIVGADSSIPSSVPMLAESLRGAGFQTAAFVDSRPGGFLGGERGFSRGFDRYEHVAATDPQVYNFDVAATVAKGLDFLGTRSEDRPFFLFVHTKAVHASPSPTVVADERAVPYNSPEPFGSRYLPGPASRFAWHEPGGAAGVRYLREVNVKIGDGVLARSHFSTDQVEELKALYDGGIRYTDHHLGRLLDGLALLGVEDDTVIIVTSDHGEAFLEHYFFFHKELFNPLLRVPLIVHDPRTGESGAVSDRVSLLDIVPTVLELAGAPELEGAAGLSLPGKHGNLPRERTFFSYFDFRQDYHYQAFAMDDGSHRFILHKLRSWPEFREEVFDLRADPGEKSPIDSPLVRKKLRAALLGKLERRGAQGEDRIELDAATIEHLRSLGYLD